MKSAVKRLWSTFGTDPFNERIVNTCDRNSTVTHTSFECVLDFPLKIHITRIIKHWWILWEKDRFLFKKEMFQKLKQNVFLIKFLTIPIRQPDGVALIAISMSNGTQKQIQQYVVANIVVFVCVCVLWWCAIAIWMSLATNCAYNKYMWCLCTNSKSLSSNRHTTTENIRCTSSSWTRKKKFLSYPSQ